MVFSSTTQQSVVYRRMYSGRICISEIVLVCVGLGSYQGDIKRRKNIKNVRVDFFCAREEK